MVAVLARPDYVEKDRIGRMIRLYCKNCGVLIGRDERGAFRRLRNYAELKMRFLGGSMHVTNVCKDCALLATESRELMVALHNADIDDMVRDVPEMGLERMRIAPRFISLDTTRSGLL
jgi:hypothetical protein